MEIPDTIEREVTIQASVDAVWKLVSEPGWWINGGAITEHQIVERDGRTVVTDPELGEFPLVVVEEREPEYVAFRWAPWDEQQQAESGTLVEFFVTDGGEGSVVVRVVESGFATLDLPAERLHDNQVENVAGWELEMGLLAATLEA